MENLKIKIVSLLRWSERYTKTDMLYLTKNSFWLGSGQVIASLFAFISSVAFANLLPVETYGSYRYLLSILSILSIATLHGIDTAVLRSVAQGKEGSVIPSLRKKISWGIWGGLAALITALYYQTQGQNEIALSLVFASIFIPFMDSFGVYAAVFKGRKDFQRVTLYDTVIRLVSTVIIVTTIFISQNLVIIILVYLISWTVARGIGFFTVYKTLSKEIDPSTMTYGKHLSAINIVGSVASQADAILLFNFMGPAMLAVYTIALAPVRQIHMIEKMTSNLLAPKFSQRSVYEIGASIWNKFFITLAIAVCVVVVYFLIAPFAFSLIFPAYPDSIMLSRIAILSFLFFPTVFFGEALRANKRIKELYILGISVPIVRLLCVAVLIPTFGIWGAIASYLSAYLTGAILAIILFFKIRNASQPK